MYKHIMHSRGECKMKKHRTVEVIDFRYESAAVPLDCIENTYFAGAGCQINRSESQDLFPDIG